MAVDRIRMRIPNRRTIFKRGKTLVPISVDKIDFAVIDRSNICIPLHVRIRSTPLNPVTTLYTAKAIVCFCFCDDVRQIGTEIGLVTWR